MIYRFCEKVENVYNEIRLGITTRGLAGRTSADEEHIHYGTIPYRTILGILDHLQLTAGDVFVDLGCGKGRVLCCASRIPIQKAVGVEYSNALSEIARKNAQQLRGRRSAIEVLTMDAAQFDFTVGTVYYLFHPFGPETLRSVLQQLESGVKQVPRRVRLVYVNPVHNTVLKDCSWLTENDNWVKGDARSPEHDIAWWQNTGLP